MLKMVDKIEKEKKMNIRSACHILTYLLIIAFLGSTSIYAGDASRVGTASGVQVQVPVGARSLGLGGADLATVSSIEALYWNPAGLGNMEGQAASLFSTQNIIADINVNYFALGFNAGRLGVLGFSLKSFSFGDIPITTVNEMDGTGSTYSPTFATIGMTYSRHLTDRVSVGVTGKVIYESVPRASASAFAVDVGIQYHNLLQIKGLALGFVIKNIGSNMQYEGTGLLDKAIDVGETYKSYRYKPTSSDQLPSTLEMGLSYSKNIGLGELLICGQFQNNNFEQDQIKAGAELALMKNFFVRGGYSMILKDPENPDYGETVYGLALGGGMNYSIGNTKLALDYAYRPIKHFGTSSNVFSIGLMF
ncbi:MAG: hypothetical protein COT43_03865 [Candidatus Marinimicrobia bacterium CG08_land_8_20_14_0_20_45_22]|nr:MAG: hypothetical protein COT43_03865 [Candidatus Marinimicrobia bacterium CG08_land_8_20_14_0_20_45_22]